MTSPTIHILGIGNLGKLLAHSLRRCHPEIPITLLFHRPSLVDEWNAAGRQIEIVRNGKFDRQNDFNYESASEDSGSKIENLIVATKTHSTVRALQPLRGRLGPRSTMLFTQNGIGTIDEVTEQLFINSNSRPNYLTAIVNHGVYATSSFSSVHAGISTAFIGHVLSNSDEKNLSSANKPPDSFLAQKIASCPELATSLVTPEQILHIQLQKLTLNAVINPLTTIFDCINGAIFQSAMTRSLIDSIIQEISLIIPAILEAKLPPGSPTQLPQFNYENLRKNVYDISKQVGKNISSMRQDMLAGRQTEIDYINGYIVQQGTAAGIACPINEVIVRLVKEKKKISENEIGDYFKG